MILIWGLRTSTPFFGIKQLKNSLDDFVQNKVANLSDVVLDTEIENVSNGLRRRCSGHHEYALSKKIETDQTPVNA